MQVGGLLGVGVGGLLGVGVGVERGEGVGWGVGVSFGQKTATDIGTLATDAETVRHRLRATDSVSNQDRCRSMALTDVGTLG
jgi:hypothetical protein